MSVIGTLGMGAANAAVGQGMGMIFGGYQDKRQIRQQKKLQDMQIAGNKEMSDYQQRQAIEMWNKTNAAAQAEHYRKAGLNVGMMYGGSGGGATTQTGGGMGVSGASAGDPNAGVGMGIQMASQIALMKAQKENIEADTENKKAGTEQTGVATETGKLDLDTKQQTQKATILTITETAAKTLAEAVQAQQKQVINEETMKDQIRSIQEEAINKILRNEGESIENRRKEAQLAVDKFEAKMAESGISPRTPWYMKLVVDLLDKIDLNPLK